ncbi:MAG TPA: diguanylate cyclase [Anaerolineales bacterium]|nr:diguanylate cyclase [Anaerolineales bacterium]
MDTSPLYVSGAPSEHDSPIGLALIADDDHDFRQMLVRRARKMGLTVVEAEDGDQAIACLQEYPFDIIVLDVYMPGATGLEVFAAARQTDPDIQAIVLTGSASLENAIEALRGGVFDFLTKPIESLAAFEIAVGRALQYRHLLRENARLFLEVQRLAVTDSLTGLFNRHKLGETIEVEVERAHRYGRPLSIIMIDMDGLKGINDTHGHQAGDLVLQQAAAAVRSQVRRVDCPTRFGGDEFVILLPEATGEEAERVANRIASRILAIRLEGTAVSASLGVAQWQQRFESGKDFLAAADAALYKAKRNGRGRVAVWSAEEK